MASCMRFTTRRRAIRFVYPMATHIPQIEYDVTIPKTMASDEVKADDTLA